MAERILIVEDEVAIRTSMARLFSGMGCSVRDASTIERARAQATETAPSLVLLDLSLPDGDSLSFMEELREADPALPIIMIAPFPRVKAAVEAMSRGAFGYVVKPFVAEELGLIVRRALEFRSLKGEVVRLRRQIGPTRTAGQIAGSSPGIQRVRELVSKLHDAPDTPVLILGEPGTEKELVSEAIHAEGTRAGGPLARLNCASIPGERIEREIFGHGQQEGLLELANGGTLLLDEIQEIPSADQLPLLRVLEGHPFRRTGGRRIIAVDARVIATARPDLDERVRVGRFREELYYRLQAFVIELPPLRERREDIPILVGDILGTSAGGPAEGVIECLLQYEWPGNLRELQNVIERAGILAGAGPIRLEHLPPEIAARGRLESFRRKSATALSLEELERLHILATLRESAGNKSEAARRLGISRKTLREKLKSYDSAAGEI